MNIYAIKNEKTQFFNRPIYTESFNEALSYIQNVLMSDADRALLGLRNDLSLYWLGTIDFVSGKIDAPNRPKKLADLAEIFESIPSERVPQTANQLRDMILDLSRRLEAIETGEIEREKIDPCKYINGVLDLYRSDKKNEIERVEDGNQNS